MQTPGMRRSYRPLLATSMPVMGSYAPSMGLGQVMGPPGQHMGPSWQLMGPPGQHMGPSGQYMGHPGPIMGPIGPNTGFLGMSGSQMGSPGMPPIPQVQPVIPNYSSPLSNLPPMQPVNQPADDLWVEATTPTGQVYYYSSQTRMSSWERPQNVCIVTQAELGISYNTIAQGSAETGIPQFNARGSAKMETSNLKGKTSQNYWNTVCKPNQTAEFQPKQTTVTGWTEYQTPDVVSNYQVQPSRVRPQVLVHLKEASQAQTTVQQNAAKDVKTDSEEKKKQTEVTEENKPESKAEHKPELKAQQKPVTKSRPVASTPIPDTVWCVVRTNDGKYFFYNPTKRHSVWKMPEELKNRPDVEKLLPPKPEVKTEIKKEKDLQEEPPSKKIKLEVVVKEEKEESSSEATQEIVLEKETTNAVKVQPAKNTPVLSLEERKKQFKELLAENDVSTSSTWETELHKVIFDKRYTLLTSREQKQAFEEYVKDRAEEEQQKRLHVKENSELSRQSLEESNLNVKLEAVVKEEKEESSSEAPQEIVLEKETTNAVKVQPAKNTPVLSLEDRKKQFKELLAENDVSTPSTRWKELYKIVFDNSSTLLTIQERKQAFGEYLKESAEEKHKKKDRYVKENSELYRQLLEESDLNATLEAEVKEEKEESSSEATQDIVLEKKTTNAAELQVAESMPLVSLEDKKKQFKELLAEKDVSTSSTWETELHKVIFDKRYALLTSLERKQAFEEYVKDRAEEENQKRLHVKENSELFRQSLEESNLNVKLEAVVKEEKEESSSEVAQQTVLEKETTNVVEVQPAKNMPVVSIEDSKEQFKELLAEKDVSTPSALPPPQEPKQTFAEYVKKRAEEERRKRYEQIKGNSALFRQLLEESNLNVKSTFKSFTEAHLHDERFGMVYLFRDKKYMFQDYINELGQQERETFELVRKKVKIDFMKMLSETAGIAHYTPWRDVRIKLCTDPRYKAAVIDSRRKNWFCAYLRAENVVKGDFMKMLSKMPDISPSTSWGDVKNKVSSDPQYKDISDIRQEEWFETYLKTVKDATSDVIKNKEEQDKRLHSPSLKEKEESGKNHGETATEDFKKSPVEKVTSDDIRKKEAQEEGLDSSSLKSENTSQQNSRDAAFEDFKQFLSENVKDTKESFLTFKERFFRSPRWTEKLFQKEKKKLYKNHIYRIQKQNREILWSILDEMDLPLGADWSKVKKEVKADPRYVFYTDSEEQLDNDYALFMYEKNLNAEGNYESCSSHSSSESSSPETGQEIYSYW